MLCTKLVVAKILGDKLKEMQITLSK
jgi:hypothetical protein